jgi:hypothetical protein
MNEDRFNKVIVTCEGKRLICGTEWVETYWVKGKSCVQWAFRGNMPKGAVAAVLEPLDKVPSKYKEAPDFIPGLPFKSVGSLPPSEGSLIPDLIAFGNLKKKGWYCYNIQLLDKDGNVLAETDPGGTNDPEPPPGGHG